MLDSNPCAEKFLCSCRFSVKTIAKDCALTVGQIGMRKVATAVSYVSLVYHYDPCSITCWICVSF
jgi:hypothetical protein